MTDTQPHPSPRVTSGFPWLSTLVALTLIGWFLVQEDPALATLVQQSLPDWLDLHLNGYFNALLAGLYGLCLLFDLHRYWRRRQHNLASLRRLQTENQDLWQHRRQLQMKVKTYSGHADKLKLFISDKLLEYIEYDEKFLHFQSIAAEVRHNGVIAFDRVQSALTEAEQRLSRADSPDKTHYFQYAGEQMRYLWDLLDLATTDNLSLHIGHLQARCEEQYYQKLLNPADAEPLAPDYRPRDAVWQSVRPLLDPATPAERWREAIADEASSHRLDDDTRIRLCLSPAGHLLGKRNHLVLLLDNLLKNAQFYTHKKRYQHKHQKVSVALDELDGNVRLRVHNRGPHIPEEEQSQIFQLGFSTRRVREHHGKGLGLFFVHEIVKGYDGQIQVYNIDNQPTTWDLRFTLTNGDVVNERVQTTLVEGASRVQTDNLEQGKEPDKSTAWSLRKPVGSIQVTQPDTGDHHTFVLTDLDTPQTLFDPSDYRPAWVLTVNPRKRGCRVVFEPLDNRGVAFEVLLPTAEARLDSTESSMGLEDIDDEVARLNEPFEARIPDSQNSGQ